MPDDYRAVQADEAERVLSGKSETETVDLTAELGLEAMRARVWFLEPGNTRKTFHRHAQQEELYYVLEGPGRLRVGDEALDVPTGTALRLPPATPRKLFNDTDRPHVWLVVGAPPVPHDGEPLTEA